MTEPTTPDPGYSDAYKAAYEAALAATPHHVAEVVDDDATREAAATVAALTTTSGRPTLDNYIAKYDPETNPHPWVKFFRAIPMGGERPPMNHDHHVLNMFAIHMERLGFPEPDTDRAEIKYIPSPFNGDALLSPGQWVDIDTDVPASPLPEIDLSGVPQEQLDVLEQAIQAEKIRKAKLQTADPNARADAELAVAAKTIDVVAAPIPEEPTP